MLLSLVTEVAADSGYGSSCNSISYYNARDGGKVIFANCRMNSGIYRVGTEINPDSCFANDNGILAARLWGRYSGSCSDVYLSGTVLHAKCKNAAGGTVSTSIDTNNYMGNSDGFMTCFGQRGLP
ncbi:hypothetical protein V499_02167 [Pseudogymnoascus sp. VKM F-103]|nr:hypothetical protein V499_02167 [Pseudogymnoascus sp. VKM F-103]